MPLFNNFHPYDFSFFVFPLPSWFQFTKVQEESTPNIFHLISKDRDHANQNTVLYYVRIEHQLSRRRRYELLFLYLFIVTFLDYDIAHIIVY